MSRRILNFKTIIECAERLLLGAFCIFLLFQILNIISPLKKKISYSQQILSSDNSLMYSFLSKDDKWRMLVETKDISVQLRKAIIYKEDRYFKYHFGVNPIAIFRAAFNNLVYQKRTSGASTITMQVARLMYPKDRTYLNKIIEIFRAFQLEWMYSKEEILNLYFNLVPYGGNIEGIKAASLIYFGRQPDRMSLGQIVTMTIIPNRPGTLRPGSNSGELIRSRNKWLNKMKADNLFPEEQIIDALKEPIDAKRAELPKFASHFSWRMHRQYPDLPIVHTNINLHQQQQLKSIAEKYSKRLYPYGIYNTSIFVINNRSHNIEAYLGSADFSDALHHGQVDGVIAVRSPGSTLKPLVYSIAFDDGLLTPKCKIADVPINIDGYSPENYNMKFNGSVTVEYSLANSLNIPAVKTLNLIGIKSLTDKMKLTGFGQVLHSEGSIGLSVVLGGCGVKLEEMTEMYSAFANHGIYYRPNFLQNDTANIIPVRLISPSAAYMISDILTQLNRPEMPSDVASSALHIPKISWKTGTSYGRRDAWSIGFNSDYTIGVWIGNFSGEGVPELTGAEMAAPLLFELFNTLDYNSSKSRLIPPAELDFRLVCPESGLLPDEKCANRIIDYYIPQVSSVRRCDHLKKVFVNIDSTYSYCTTCLPLNGYSTVEYPNLEPDILTYYESEHVTYRKIPPHNPKCNRLFEGHPPQIKSLLNKKEYTVERNEKNPPQLLLAASVSNDVNLIYWYINDRYYKTVSPGQDLFFIPKKGKIKISCSDDKGRNSDIEIVVKDF